LTSFPDFPAFALIHTYSYLIHTHKPFGLKAVSTSPIFLRGENPTLHSRRRIRVFTGTEFPTLPSPRWVSVILSTNTLERERGNAAEGGVPERSHS
jgi:hypothetical protein